LGGQLVTLRLKPISVRASVSGDTITIERLVSDVVESAQTMNRTPAGRFELKMPPRLFGVAVHPVHDLHFNGHRVRLPSTFLLRSEELRDEWNHLLDAIPGDSVSA
ncbi:MAG: hypothetical protein U1E29_07715, partial [Coriobacteriia bacterium]|nr:hypothetical protein [Coriobacteriia bacterium]